MKKVSINKKYKIANEVYDVEDNTSIGKVIMQYGIIAIICVLSFLVAKYIVRSAIEGEKSPIDTSERL